MKRFCRFSVVFMFLSFCIGISVIAEEISLTTYYPAPYGAYEELIVDRELTDNTDAVTGISVNIDETGTNAGIVTGLSIDTSGVSDGTVYSAIIQGGNIGIGTNAPSANVHIYDNNPAIDQVMFVISAGMAATPFSVDEDGDVVATGDISAASYTSQGSAGDSGTFVSADGKTITVTNGIITDITP